MGSTGVAEVIHIPRMLRAMLCILQFQTTASSLMAWMFEHSLILSFVPNQLFKNRTNFSSFRDDVFYGQILLAFLDKKWFNACIATLSPRCQSTNSSWNSAVWVNRTREIHHLNFSFSAESEADLSPFLSPIYEVRKLSIQHKTAPVYKTNLLWKIYALLSHTAIWCRRRSFDKFVPTLLKQRIFKNWMVKDVSPILAW